MKSISHPETGSVYAVGGKEPFTSKNKDKKSSKGLFRGITIDKAHLKHLLYVMVLIGGLSSLSWFSFNAVTNQRKLDELATQKGGVTVQNDQEIIESVARHILLPKNEDPQIATVQDVDALVQKYPFFEGASDGDQLLMYPQHQKVFLYDPDDDILVNVGPLVVNNDEPTEEPDNTEKDVAGVSVTPPPVDEPVPQPGDPAPAQ